MTRKESIRKEKTLDIPGAVLVFFWVQGKKANENQTKAPRKRETCAIQTCHPCYGKEYNHHFNFQSKQLFCEQVYLDACIRLLYLQ